VEYLTGKSIYFVEGDITSEKDLERVFQAFHFWAVIHFAAIKAVGESTQIPLEYYHNNVTGSLHLFRVMNRYKVKNLVFSSSATVYGEPDMMPVNETASLGPVTNPYGRTKLFVEEMLRDVCASDPDWNVCLLRFFNPVGAHPSGLMGECPQGIPNNLLPYVIRVLQGHLPCVQIFGSDYDTVDGTGVRDYIHVCDLATGHVAALKRLEGEESEGKRGVRSASSSPSPTPQPSPTTTAATSSVESSPLPSSTLSSSQRQGGHCTAYNLGTGVGYSVLEIISAMEKATQKTIPYKIVERRQGDVGVCTADATLANLELGWKPLYSMDDMCRDMWRWTRRNPNGYDGPLIDDDD
jgi:UDP-glucose 4-epimerase